MKASIVIRSFNEERWLPDVFSAIERQQFRDFEVLLVDSGSVDRSREIGAAHGARIVRLRPEDFTFGHALNFGIKEARGQIVVMLSAHAIPVDEHWLGRLLAPFEHPDTAMVFGGQRGHSLSKFSEARDFERVFPSKPIEMDDDHVFCNNANSAIRRDLWELHPFDEGLPGLEDAEWAKYWIPQGKRVWYEPAATVYHVHTETWAQVRHRFHREGVAGRWTAVRIIRNIPGEVLRESWWTVADLWQAWRRGKVGELAGEIFRYRYNKTVGIVKGILDSRTLDNPSKRAELYYEQSFPAVVIRNSHHAGLEQRTIPSLKPGEILVRVAFTGICATDLEILEGRLGYYKSGMAKYPIVPGHELSGTVVSIGKKVTTFKEGDRVVVECIQGCGSCPECQRDNAIACRERAEVGVIRKDGGYAAYLVTGARYAHRVPDGLSLAQAAIAEPLAVVIKGLRRLGGSNGGGPRQCAVLGGGTIGHLAARVLALRGHQVTVFDREASRLARLNGQVATSQELTGLERFDWLVEATGDQGVLEAVLQQSKTGATILLLGLPYAQHPFTFESLVGFDKAVVGSVGSNGADFDDALSVLPGLDMTAFLQSTFPLESYRQAWEAVRARTSLKVMLRVDADAV